MPVFTGKVTMGGDLEPERVPSPYLVLQGNPPLEIMGVIPLRFVYGLLDILDFGVESEPVVEPVGG